MNNRYRKRARLISVAVAAIALSIGGLAGTANAVTSTATFRAARCTTAHLTGTVASDNGGGAAGSVYEKIVLKNTGAHSCTLQGWAGVSFVGHGNGTQLGAAALQNRTGLHATVTIHPRKTASVPVRVTQAANYPASTCGTLTKADGFRVYPPGSKTSIFVAARGTQGCTSTKVKLLTVSAVQPAR